jgi:hypothetical protein
MDTREQLRLYNDPKYWNLELRDDFLSQTRSMWINLCNKYEGRVVNIANLADDKQIAMARRIDREIDEAIAKHGEIVPTVAHEVEKEEELFKSRKRIAEAAL